MIKTAVFSSLFGLFFVLGLAGSAVYFGGDHVAENRADAVIVSLPNLGGPTIAANDRGSPPEYPHEFDTAGPGGPNSTAEPVVVALAPPDPRRLETAVNSELSVAETAEFSPAAGPTPEAADDVADVSGQTAPSTGSEPLQTQTTAQTEAASSPVASSEDPPSSLGSTDLAQDNFTAAPEESAMPSDSIAVEAEAGAEPQRPSPDDDSMDLASVTIPDQLEATTASPPVSPDVEPIGDATGAEPSEPSAIPLPTNEVSEEVVVVRRSNLRQSPTVDAPIMGKLIVGDRAVQKTEKPVEGYHRVIASDAEGWIWFLNIEPAISDSGVTGGSEVSSGEASDGGEVAE
jgi:hypothetical protein